MPLPGPSPTAPPTSREGSAHFVPFVLEENSPPLKQRRVIEVEFKALSDPLRRQILMILREGERSAGDIASELNITPAALSYHLNLLKKADLLMEYKQKNYIYYQLNTTLFDELVMWLKQFGGEESEK